MCVCCQREREREKERREARDMCSDRYSLTRLLLLGVACFLLRLGLLFLKDNFQACFSTSNSCHAHVCCHGSSGYNNTYVIMFIKAQSWLNR